jgi:hypothetical protein
MPARRSAYLGGFHGLQGSPLFDQGFYRIRRYAGKRRGNPTDPAMKPQPVTWIEHTGNKHTTVFDQAGYRLSKKEHPNG